MLRASSIALLIAGFAASTLFAQSNDDVAVFDATLVRFASDSVRLQKTAPKYLVFDETTVVLPQDLGYAAKDLPKQLVDELLTNNNMPQSIGKYSPPSPFRLSSAGMLGPVLRAAKSGLVRPHYYNWDFFVCGSRKLAASWSLLPPHTRPMALPRLSIFGPAAESSAEKDSCTFSKRRTVHGK
jgi:hypothetical protein